MVDFWNKVQVMGTAGSKTLFLILICLLFPISDSTAFDGIILRSGSKVPGEVLSVSNASLILRCEGAEMSFPVSLIHAIVRGDLKEVLNPLKKKIKSKLFLNRPKKAKAKEKKESSENENNISRLTARVKLPSPVYYSFSLNRWYQPVFKGLRSESQMRRSAGILVYLVNNKKGDKTWPFWYLKLGNILADIDEDAAAFQELLKVTQIPDGTPTNSKIKTLTTLTEIRNIAKLIRARILGRNGLKKETLDEIRKADLSTGYANLLAGEALYLAGDKEAARGYIRTAFAKKTGHPAGGWTYTFVPMRSAALAHLAGDNSLAVQAGQKVVDRGENAEKYMMWKAGWALTKHFVDLAKAKRNVDWASLKTGVFKGSARGFNGNITVKVRVSGGKVKSIKVISQKESRPFSALEIIPKRIILHQDLQVDTVSGATLTSLGVIAASENALLNASGR